MSNGSKRRRAAKRAARDRASSDQQNTGMRRREDSDKREPSNKLSASAPVASVLDVQESTNVRQIPKVNADSASDSKNSVGSSGEQREPVKLELKDGDTLSEEDYAAVAEKRMKELVDEDKKLTTTKLRNIYSLIMYIYGRAGTEKEYSQRRHDIQYLKVRMAYKAGRDDSVERFLTRTYLMKYVDAVTCFEQFMLYCRYAEALVAYFKFFGGKDS